VKHIIIITTSYPEICDGSEAAGSFVVDFATALAKKIKVTVIAPGLKGGNDERHGNLAVYRFYTPRKPLSLLKVYNPLHWPAIVRTLINGKKAVEYIAKNHIIDHIFALWLLPSGYWARAVGKRFDIPYSTWALGSDIWSLGRIPVVKTILRRVLQKSFKNFADGFQLRDDVIKLSRRRCDFLPSTRLLQVPCEKKLSQKPKYRLAFLGRWHRNKGIDLLLDSLNTLNNKDWRLIEEVRICGGGPMGVCVKKQTSLLQQKGCPVSVQGYLNKDEALKLLMWADYILIPSRIESIPVIFSDAMKCRCPVVCMPVGDLPRLLKKYSVGVMAEDITGQSFGFAINQILQNCPQEYRTELYRAASDYNLDQIVEILLMQLVSCVVPHVK